VTTAALRRILLVEDDPVDTELTLGLLREGLSESTVTHAGTIAAALGVIAAGDVDAVLLDLRLPDGTGTDALRRVQAASAAPVVVLTSVVDDVLAIELVRAGADDYLVKGRLGPESLARVLRFATQRHAREGAGGGPVPADRPVVALLGGHALLLDGLSGALTASGSYAVLGPCATVEALEAARGRRLDVAVVDVARLSGGPLLPLAHLRLRLAGSRILLLADAPDRWLHAVLDDDYADGLIEHTSSAAQVLQAVGRILDDQVVLPPGWRAQRERQVACDPLAALSDRQREVLALVAAGLSNDAIAGELYISVNTVKFHVRSAYRALGINSRLQAAQLLAAPAA
jgi:DNA-binding NarL/FixJ family response regulator